MAFTSALAPAWLPQMNMVGGPPGSFGFTMSAFPTHENALTRFAAGARFCRRSIRDSETPPAPGRNARVPPPDSGESRRPITASAGLCRLKRLMVPAA